MGAAASPFGRMWCLAALDTGAGLIMPSCPGLSQQGVIRVRAILALNLSCLAQLQVTESREWHLPLRQFFRLA